MVILGGLGPLSPSPFLRIICEGLGKEKFVEERDCKHSWLSELIWRQFWAKLTLVLECDAPCEPTEYMEANDIEFTTLIQAWRRAIPPGTRRSLITIRVEAAFVLRSVADVQWSKMRDDTEYADMKFLSNDGGEFPCHRIVLASSSHVFAAMLSSEFRESKTRCVQLPECSFVVLNAFLDCKYRRALSAQTCISVTLELLRVACMYAIPEIVEVAAYKLQKSVTEDNARSIFECLHTHRDRYPCITAALEDVLRQLRTGSDALLLKLLLPTTCGDIEPPGKTHVASTTSPRNA